MKNTITIKELAKKLGLVEETIRKWESRYSIEVKRNSRNSRYYTDDLVIIFEKIKELKDKKYEDEEIFIELKKIFNLGLDVTSNESKLLQLSENNHNSNLFIEEIKTTIKDNNELALRLASVSAEMGFLKGKLHYIEDENSSLKKEAQLTKIESKKILELNQELLNKEKELNELKLKINIISIELQSKDYLLNEGKKENDKLNLGLLNLQHKLIEVSNMSILNKIKFKYDKND